jgi:LysM repeat protein
VSGLADGGDCSYTVKAGDTLFNIGKAHGLTVAQLLQYNPEIKDPDHIEVGQVRMLPVSYMTEMKQHFQARKWDKQAA